MGESEKVSQVFQQRAFGEALDTDKLEPLGRYEVHLDRKLERMFSPCCCGSRKCGRVLSRPIRFVKPRGVAHDCRAQPIAKGGTKNDGASSELQYLHEQPGKVAASGAACETRNCANPNVQRRDNREVGPLDARPGDAPGGIDAACIAVERYH